jgi:hypothetical protein
MSSLGGSWGAGGWKFGDPPPINLPANPRGGVITYNPPESCVGFNIIKCAFRGIGMSVHAHEFDIVRFALGAAGIALLTGIVFRWMKAHHKKRLDFL